MIYPFPVPGEQVRLAYRELHIAINGTEEQKKALGNHALLPRPWEPATCLDPELRHELWQWLEDVVIWLNHEYTWDVAGLIPSCWPLHPHLVHEIAVLADQRRRAGLANDQRRARGVAPLLPARLHRPDAQPAARPLRRRAQDAGRPSRDTTSTWPRPAPSAARTPSPTTSTRCPPADGHANSQAPAGPPRLGLVDLDTGEIHDDDRSAAQPRTRTEKGPRE